VQRGLDQQRQSVGLLLRPGRRRRRRVGLWIRTRPSPLVEGFARRLQGTPEQRADVRRQPAVDHDRPVLVFTNVQLSGRGLPSRDPGLGLAIDAPPAAHDALDVCRRPGASDRQQARFVLGCRDPSERAGLRVG
jgi:hypothetical protein